MSEIENGGAIAIKGFNYQKASIILVMIHNYKKDNFKVIPESSEDFEIQLGDTTFFIQVKGTKKLSVKNLIKRTKKRSGAMSPSIIEKNLAPGNDTDKRKIFLWDLSENTKDKLVSQIGNLVSPIYCLSNEQKETVKESLELDNSQKNRLDNQKIYITPFSNDLDVALTMLKGVMVSRNLLVTNDRAKIVLGELSLEIDQKSEILVTNDSDIERKEINGEYLKKVFINIQQKELFDEVLNNLSINSVMKYRIKMEKSRIPLIYQTVKDNVKKQADTSLIKTKSDDEAINYFLDILKAVAPEIENTELSTALAIDCFCELGGVNL
ncbi:MULTISPECIES: dsDNA nuclease domain-containing protein [Bacillus cereus group]|uniref:dsDNA nuclease domain-containing protein n=1 Tax=Bacillus cereus group TaxID=86661 RepID=UPI001C02D2C2|nr:MULTISPECIES: dsDNA nuclease domain-containing protein [Bacillus cereus group]QWI48170.1 DUF4297 domain-containing protein [Bacillus mycoides]WJE21070.1 dsDNA nuclease domain-containing protein [Bacillus cereus]